MLRRLQDRNVHVLIATGRMPFDVLRIVSELGIRTFNEYAICSNGSQIISLETGQLVWRKRLPWDSILQVAQYCQDNDLCLECYVPYAVLQSKFRHLLESDAYPDGQIFLVATQDNEQHRAHAVMTRLPSLIVTREEFLRILSEDVPTKLLIPGPATESPQKKRDLIARLDAGQCRVCITKPIFTEVMPRGVSKGAALAWVCANKYSADPADVVAVGDAPNDIELLQAAGRGYAVRNATCPELLAAADEHLERTNREDAVAHLIARWVGEE
eukprot:gnl/Trimastix_PCT/3963.p1 GENE.gnl/Trimastix_PCT/3963~~gnl/Trimastix_PCT/3963.p1  ORF type:complete len:310 (+),score=39.42 gnl/Trimastix_PCT/3963:120-932(+)